MAQSSESIQQNEQSVDKWEKNEGRIIKVDSLSAFFIELEKLPKKTGSSSFHYRGHNDFKYELKPFLFREDNYKTKEHLIFKEMLKESPEHFSEDKSTFEKLARMQHFGLPTRLLDITKNPLAALYFACILSNGDVAKENDGDVIVLSVNGKKAKYNDDDAIIILSNLCNLTYGEKTNFYKKGKEILLEKIKNEKPVFCNDVNLEDLNYIVPVKATKSNERIRAQDGLFLLFGLGEEKINSIDTHWVKEHIIIDKDKKDEILNQLEKVNISAKTLFPDLEGTVRFLKRRHRHSETKQKEEELTA
jgi:hypothetical protein